MKILTHSSISDFRSCPRSYYYKYEKRRVRVSESAALSFGRIMHHVLHLWWTDGRDAAIGWLQRNALEMSDNGSSKLVAMLKHYNPPMDEYEVVSLEETDSMPVPHVRGYKYQMRRDGIIRKKKTGELILLERKSTSEKIDGWSSYWQRVAGLDHQVRWYSAGEKIRKIAYEVLRKPAIRQRETETSEAFTERCIATIGEEPDSYYQWREIVLTDADIDDSLVDLEQWVRVVRTAKKNRWFPKNPGSCRSVYGTCPYFDVCSGVASIDDDSQFRTKTAEHEELQ